MSSEAAAHADFSAIRYAQCWEDADILLEGLKIQTGDTCLSIASAGDNSLAMLAKGAGRVIALDLNPSQLACLELRVAAYRELTHPELLELIGSVPSLRRPELYRRCRPLLKAEVRAFWDAHSLEVDAGIGGAGKFERYFSLFRERIMPLVHSSACIELLLAGGDANGGNDFTGKSGTPGVGDSFSKSSFPVSSWGDWAATRASSAMCREALPSASSPAPAMP